MRTVSFHPSSLGSGAMAGPGERSAPHPRTRPRVERLAGQDLDVDQVEMDRVRVTGQVDDLPDLGAAGLDDLGRLSTYSRPNSGTVFTAVSVPRNWIRRPCLSKVSLRVRRLTGTCLGFGVGTPGVCFSRKGSVGVKAAGSLIAGSAASDPGLDPDLEQRPRVGSEARASTIGVSGLPGK